MASIGLESCLVDPTVFYGKWTSPPDPSIPMPVDNAELFTIIPMHVDNGLMVTNSVALYTRIMLKLNKRFKLLYPTVCTCPDIAFMATALGQYNAHPTHEVATAAKSVLQYLASSCDLALKYGGDHAVQTLSETDIDATNVAFSDSN
ncbi:hypothetical protein EDD18DRAFT_1099959 [Armillaria luteobubalina]|uniref:Uncharacterized protein n=1 Tax=Armillaria luteobubalina TaxID=153913 RepID=A0AA39V2I7_9AGAR|nr:hypothetical protein EDD18DRAFT_1099959 [Armillaria luteobubalina]